MSQTSTTTKTKSKPTRPSPTAPRRKPPAKTPAEPDVLVIDPQNLPGGGTYRPRPQDPVRAFQVAEPFRALHDDGTLTDEIPEGSYVIAFADGGWTWMRPEDFDMNYEPNDR